MKKITLSATPRTVLGRKVRNLRTQGYLPATVYGHGKSPLSLQVATKEFESVYKEAGETTLVYLGVADEKPRPILIKMVQKEPTTGTLLHIDFHQVNLKEKVHATVPITPTGEAAAVTEKIGVVLTPFSQVEIEALPTELIDHIEVDVTHLAQIGDQVTAGDLTLPEGVALVTDPSQVLLVVGELVTKEAEADALAEAEAAEAASEEVSPETAEEEAADEPETESAAPKE